VASLVHVPFFNVAGARDAVVPVAGVRAHQQALTATGAGHRYRERPRANHETFVAEGYGTPEVAGFLGEAKVHRDPPVVQFVYAPGTDHPGLGLVHDHAYWVSGLRVAFPGADGRVDARSLAQGPPMSRQAERQEHSVENRLTVTMENLRFARFELEPAGLQSTRPLVVDLTSDSHGAVFLAGPFPADTTVEGGPRWRPTTASETGVLLPVVPGTARYVLRPAPSAAT
jgi:hypothetical protein